MSRPRLLLAAGGLVLAAPAALALQPTGLTAASWSETASVGLPDAVADTLHASVFDASVGVDHLGPATQTVSSPGLTVTNDSAAQRTWLDVQSTRVTVPVADTSSTLLADVSLDYDVTGAADCSGALDGASPYWSVRGAGAVVDGETYTRPSAAVPGAVLAPGASLTVCPWVRPTADLGTPAGRRDFLRAHAARRLLVRTEVRQVSESPATWFSATETLTTAFQVKAPAPTTPSVDATVCASTDAGGVRDAAGAFGGLYWAWPYADGSDPVATAAIDRFVVLRSVDQSSWAPFRRSGDQSGGAAYAVSGDDRATLDIDPDHLNGGDGAVGPGAWTFYTVRAYPFAGSGVHIDADWVVALREHDGAVECGTVTANPAAGPQGLG